MTMVSTHWVGALTIETSSGNLASLTSEEMRSEESLTLVGTMDVRDFVAMPDLFPSLRTLDISAVAIEEFVAIDRLLGGKTFFEADALPAQAFFGMGLTSVALPQGLKKISEGAFTAVPLKKIDIPTSVVTIGDYSFYDCDELESITLTSEIETIGSYVFAGCDRLATADLSSARLKSVSEAAFANCVSLKDNNLRHDIHELRSFGKHCIAVRIAKNRREGILWLRSDIYRIACRGGNSGRVCFCGIS